MVNVNDRILSAFKGLNASPQFHILLEWMRDSLKEQDKKNRHEENTDSLRKGQGRALVLEAILRANEDALSR